MASTYHAFDFAKYAPRYLADFQFRFNRRYTMHAMLLRLLRAMAVTQPLNTARIRAPEVAR